MPRHVLVPKKRAAPAIPLQGALDGFLLDGRARRLSPRTIQNYRQMLSGAVRCFTAQGVAALADLAAPHIRAWFVALQDQGWQENSVHTAATTLRAWLNWCVTEGLLPASPLARVKLPRRSRHLLPAFSEADMRALLAACDDNLRDRAIVLLLLDTGVRASECVALDCGDVAADGAVSVQRGKGGKGRVTFLGAQAGRAVRRWLLSRGEVAPADPLWVSETTGARLTRGGLQQVLERIGARAGVAHCTAHTYRRTFALECLRRGMDVFTLQRLMGHADLTVLRRYLDQNRDDLQAAHREHGPVDALLRGGRRA